MQILNWKMYFKFILLYELCAIAYLGIYSEVPFNINAVVSWVFIVGLWGFVYQKRMLSRYVWLVVFYCSILTLFQTWLVEPFVLYEAGYDGFVILKILLFSLPGILLPWALFMYSNKSNALWVNT